MAKKKSQQRSGASKADEPGAEASQDSLGDVTEDAPTEEPAGAVGSSDGATDSELQEARAEIARLREEVNSKDKEIANLRHQLDARDATPKLDQSKLQDLGQLQERLAVLRKEQAEADTKRDTAWQQLKAVVQDISKLASPDYLQSINIPSQS